MLLCVASRLALGRLGFEARESRFSERLSAPQPNDKQPRMPPEGYPVRDWDATQTKLFWGLRVAGEQLFSHKAATFWTPHSGRNFLPSAAMALDIYKSDRDVLGGWAAQQSDTYSRVSKSRVAHVQNIAWNGKECQPRKQLPGTRGLLSLRRCVSIPRTVRDPDEEVLAERAADQDVEVLGDDEGSGAGHGDERATEAARVECCENPKTWRSSGRELLGSFLFRSTLEPGFYIAVTPKRKFWIPHHLGLCYMTQASTFSSSYTCEMQCRIGATSNKSARDVRWQEPVGRTRHHRRRSISEGGGHTLGGE